MLSIAIHTPPVSLSTPNTSENGEITNSDKIGDDHHLTNGCGPTLTTDKDTSLTTARCCFGIISTDDAIYAVGGYDRGDCLDTIEQFDPIEDKWNLLSIPMTSRRGRVSAGIVDNKIYVCGGSDGQKELDTGEYLDLKTMDKWTPIKDLAKPVAHGGKILIK
jgi:influenza virus NS1A-binding protein